MKATMTVPATRIQLLQELVKQHNLRFCWNPYPLGDNVYVEISAEHLPPGGANAFFADWYRLNKPIREVSAPVWKRWLRAARGHLSDLCR